MHERARNGRPPCDLLLRDHNDVNGDRQRRKRIAQTHHLAQLAVEMLLDHEEIQVAVLTRIPTRPRAKEYDSCRGTRGCRQPLSCIHDHRVADHMPHGTE